MDSTKEFNCIFCKETFESKEELQIHFRKHGDPKFNQSTKSKVRSNETPGDKANEEIEMISCDVCTELFPSISKAITHKHKFHPDHDAKYFCPWCGKLFTMKHLYNKHISANHDNIDQSEGEDFPCDCCDVTFHVSSAMLYHNKFFHRQDTDLPAIGHSKKYKMANQCSMMIYYCPFCGQEYNNKVNLHKHMKDDHCDENQSPDDVLRCPLCDAIFYHLDAYEHHLSFHSIEDIYNEKNDMAESVAEFSLESVPPIMERVENLEPESKETSAGGAMGLDDLLHMAMGNSVDEDNRKKSKKHKKHKKSKKAAITLDEFLNMNKDVFGEGLDFQGIEEVPSQVVAKRFKVKKKAALPNSGSKMSPRKIEKLRSQGIVIKKKGSSVKNPILTKVNQIANKNVINENTQHTQNQSNTVNASNEVLTKLINQSNNQIKIVRKPAQNKSEANSMEDERPLSPENIEIECDLIQRYTSSETEGDEKPENKYNNLNEDNISDNDLHKAIPLDNVNAASSIKNCFESEHKLPTNELHNDADDRNDAEENIDRNDKLKNSNTLTALKNVSEHITVKSVISSVKTNETPKNEVSANENHDNSSELKQKGHSEIKDTNDKDANDKSIDALKHLSHLITIKPVTRAKTAQAPATINCRDFPDVNKTDNDQVHSDDDESINNSQIDTQKGPTVKTNQKIITPEPKQAPLKTSTTFKNVCNKVAIKPITKKIPCSQTEICHSSEEDDQILNSVLKKPAINQSNVHAMTVKQQNIVKNPRLSPKVIQSGMKTNPIKEASFANNESIAKSQSSVDLLKNLKNVTAKPIINSQNAQINKCTIGPNQKLPQIKNKKEMDREIEIYNIDDSDSDNADNPLPNESLCKTKVAHIQAGNLNATPMHANALKNLNKHLTIKSSHQITQQVNIKPDPDQDDHAELPQEDSTETEYCEEKNKEPLNKTNKILQNKLKKLSKHITIKSRNSSPSSVVSTHGNKNEDSNEKFNVNNFDSDNDSNPGQVKITEVDDKHAFSGKEDEFDEDFSDNAFVQSPHESGSDNNDEDLDDIESKIHANTVRRIETKHEETFKNIGKGITIKSLAAPTKSLASLPSNLNKELSIKPLKQGNDIISQTSNENHKGTGQQIARCTNQSSNQKMCVAKNQTNTVNKEVTVKTFQTKTVIQEITTTVTKTIKTVNQTMKQEVQTASQSCTQNVLQKVQGMRPQTEQPIKNYQGVVVRHAGPVMGTKVRNTSTPVKPRPPANVSNQIVPMRSSTPMNVKIPRMPTIRSSTPSTSTNSPKPVKMSPNIVNTAMKKRPVAQETTGPFSCFKKQKESLIPVTEMSSFNSRAEESMISFASSTQMNKSNIMNMKRTMKGNTVVTSTQMKSEVSSCSQQLDKLNNVTGLRIVKTNQVKHAAHVEEKLETSPVKNITLEAIEKLQKQGLLVKKPRLDTNEEGGYSDNEDGSDFGQEDDDFDDDCFS